MVYTLNHCSWKQSRRGNNTENYEGFISKYRASQRKAGVKLQQGALIRHWSTYFYQKALFKMRQLDIWLKNVAKTSFLTLFDSNLAEPCHVIWYFSAFLNANMTWTMTEKCRRTFNLLFLHKDGGFCPHHLHWKHIGKGSLNMNEEFQEEKSVFMSTSSPDYC